MEWRADQPIYRQIADVIAARIADASLLEGASIPSVRQLASDFRVNHLTVNKAYQSLIDDEVLCAKRGVGVFVCEGAQAKLQESLQRTFFEVELPYVYHKAQRLGINSTQLCECFVRWEQEQ